jgi:hypothetical protein
MKFTHVLKFNSVPEWRESYLNYAQLKKLIQQASQAEATEAYEGHPPGNVMNTATWMIAHTIVEHCMPYRRLQLHTTQQHPVRTDRVSQPVAAAHW